MKSNNFQIPQSIGNLTRSFFSKTIFSSKNTDLLIFYES